MKEKVATVKDVAALAGVAPSTVSLVLNNSPKVKKETREKVLEAVKALHYIPNNFAVALRQKQETCMGILVPDLYNPFYLKIVKGIKEKANEYQIPIYISETNYNLDKEKHELDFFRSIRVNAYVFIGTHQDEALVEEMMQTTTSRIVYIDKYDETEKVPYIIMDNYQSGYDAATYLLRNNRKKIRYMTQSILTKPLEERRNGVLDALYEQGIAIDGVSIQINDLSVGKIQAGYDATLSLLQKDVPEAIITSSDQIAFGVMRALYEKGIQVPKEVSIIGFDNIDMSQYCIPALTTISQPCERMGQLAFELLQQPEDNHTILPMCYKLKQDLIIRESVIPYIKEW